MGTTKKKPQFQNRLRALTALYDKERMGDIHIIAYIDPYIACKLDTQEGTLDLCVKLEFLDDVGPFIVTPSPFDSEERKAAEEALIDMGLKDALKDMKYTLVQMQYANTDPQDTSATARIMHNWPGFTQQQITKSVKEHYRCIDEQVGLPIIEGQRFLYTPLKTHVRVKRIVSADRVEVIFQDKHTLEVSTSLLERQCVEA